jgi:hypothetical protein
MVALAKETKGKLGGKVRRVEAIIPDQKKEEKKQPAIYERGN